MAKRSSVKVRLIGMIALLSAAMIGLLLYQSLAVQGRQWRMAQALATANDMADHILLAAAQQAMERGATNTALAQQARTGRVETTLLGRIRAARQAGDAEMERALSLAARLADVGLGGERFRRDLARALSTRKALAAARIRVDDTLDGNGSSITWEEWTDLATRSIDAAAEMRNSAFSPMSETEAAVFNNMQIKQALWLAAEYAGRERAALGGYIAARAPVPAGLRSVLERYSGIVDLQLDFIQRVVRPLLTDERHKDFAGAFRHALQEVESVFFGSFQQIRDDVYAAADTGLYPLDEAAWMEKSTQAIDILLALSEVISADARRHALDSRSESQFGLAVSALLLVIATGIGALAILLVLRIVRNLRMLQTAITAAERDSDLTIQAEIESNDELGDTARAFNQMLAKFEEILRFLTASTNRLAAAVAELASVVKQTDDGVRRQRTETDQVAVAMTEMAATVGEVARNAAHAAEATRQASAAAGSGKAIVAQTITAIGSLADEVQQAAGLIHKVEEESRGIGVVLDVIRGIAEQTNLLALNAAIEAARAGELGRGFAVVADEVRTLAQGTQQSTQQIREVIERLQVEASGAVEAMERGRERALNTVQRADQAGNALDAIDHAVATIAGMGDQIATASEEQSTVAEGIDRNIATISQIAEQTSKGTAQVVAASMDLEQLATQLRAIVYHFKVRDVCA